ncbi:Histone deacetylase 19 [Dichanthelium oligosanthes]|uniref:Histone deacetylase n=1 Tax=Dichanthelium oligosanthes TaxID=888268 RepID=A0A1E5W4G9_9POAL|nr:Histone deacetylase 19 [Dichanthelium oligosanthes]
MDKDKNCSVAPPPQQHADGGGKKRVCYYYDPRISYVDYGEKHEMVPHRVAMTHGLVKSYGLLDLMDRLRVAPATKEDLLLAHSEDYLNLLRDLTPAAYDNDEATRKRAAEHRLGSVPDEGGSGCLISDNPVIEDLWDYCLRYAGGSLAAARALASGRYEIAINWSGGMHHACEDKASGFCYVNDIVVAIKALLVGRFERVLYVDIDAHHGDGVENAFLKESRVMTVSFHQYDGKKFFPRTGDVKDVGATEAMYRTLNVPLDPGTGDVRYHKLFQPIMERVMDVFRPDAVVLQCGADSLAGDRIAGLGLSVRGHGKCVRFLCGYDLPLLLLGGGGYTINHVASCWCYETAVAIGKEIPDDIPHHEYDKYYQSQGYKLHYHEADRSNGKAQTKHMAEVKQRVMEHLDQLSDLMAAAPCTQPADKEPSHAIVIDGDALAVDRLLRGEDPVERLYRRCGEVDLTEFLMDLGEKELMKRRKVDLD